eukprot:SAG22_NODE_933_length_6434_cov_5.195264_2_plen_480_part_00
MRASEIYSRAITFQKIQRHTIMDHALQMDTSDRTATPSLSWTAGVNGGPERIFRASFALNLSAATGLAFVTESEQHDNQQAEMPPPLKTDEADGQTSSIRSLAVESVLAPVVGIEPTTVAGTAGSLKKTTLPIRVSWEVTSSVRGDTQQAYELVVAGATSGKVAWSANSSATGGVPLPPAFLESSGGLAPNTEYAFSVRGYMTSGKGAPTAWTNSSFSTGLFADADWHGAQWIGAGNGGPDGDHRTNSDPDAAVAAPAQLKAGLWFRKTFTLTAPAAEARLFIAHAGFYKCKIGSSSGGPAIMVDDHELGATTTFWTRLYYDSYNVSHMLPAAGDYALTCLVGKGRYGEATANAVAGRVCRPEQHSHGPPCGPGIRVLLSLRGSGGGGGEDLVVSDDSWSAIRSPVTSSDFFSGEMYDASLELPAYELPGHVPAGGGEAAALPLAATNGSGFEGPVQFPPPFLSFSPRSPCDSAAFRSA